MLGETPGPDGIQDTQHPSGGIPPDIVWAMVTAGTEALPAIASSLRLAPDSPLLKYYDGSVAYG